MQVMSCEQSKKRKGTQTSTHLRAPAYKYKEHQITYIYSSIFACRVLHMEMHKCCYPDRHAEYMPLVYAYMLRQSCGLHGGTLLDRESRGGRGLSFVLKFHQLSFQSISIINHCQQLLLLMNQHQPSIKSTNHRFLSLTTLQP